MNTLPKRCAAWLLVALGGVWVAWLGGHVQTMGDYPGEFAPAMNALLAGHIHAFSRLLPADGAGGSVLLRAPAALLGKLLVGGQPAIFRFGALSCELAAGGLGLVLARDMRRRGISAVSQVGTVGLCVLAAAILDAIFFGHPEETLGATLCIAAVLLSGAGSPALAGLALGCALINKPWGVLAIPPVVLASQWGLVRLGVATTAVLAAWLGLAFGFDPFRFFHSLSSAAGLDVVAHPVDVWWPLAHSVRQAGITPYYAPPAVLVDHAREIAVLIAIPLSVPLALSRLRAARLLGAIDRHLTRMRPLGLGDRESTDAALALLALLFLLRCMLDPSDHVYYSIPFVLAMLAWESRARHGPVLALLAAGLLWLVFHTISGIAGLWWQYAAYMLVTLPFVILLWRPATAGTPRSSRLPRRPIMLSWHSPTQESSARSSARS